MKNKHKPRFEKERLRRGVYLLPNLFTALNLFFGFLSVISSINGHFITAAYAILIAGVFDSLDGKVARATRSTSHFGVEFDSLADLIAFGMAPALMIYLSSLSPMGRIGWLAAFLFVACGGLRLARFNSQVGKIGSDFFIGLPIPAAAYMNAVTVLFLNRLNLIHQVQPIIFLIMLYVLSFLMVSTIRYPSFKNAAFFRRKNFNILVTAIMILIFIAAQPPIALFFIVLAYIITGPFFFLRHHLQVRRRPEAAHMGEEQESDPFKQIN
jgi:CDP-diacylglycerol--serine O-phosphatidyltransferase